MRRENELRILPVGPENRAACLGLRTAPGQEGFVESVEDCLREAQGYGAWRPVALLRGEEVVGFAMYGFFPMYKPAGRVWLDRLLIGAAHQGRGYGRRARPAPRAAAGGIRKPGRVPERRGRKRGRGAAVRVLRLCPDGRKGRRRRGCLRSPGGGNPSPFITFYTKGVEIFRIFRYSERARSCAQDGTIRTQRKEKSNMEKAVVYFTDFRCPVGTSLTDKLRRLCIAAGMKNMDLTGKFVAIKMHFGELGNLAFLRPNYAKVVVDLCKEMGGLPFLTDCNTLYPGSRRNALEHLDCANLNGFWPMTTGCQILIGDGLRGTDDVEVPVKNGEFCKTARIGRAIMDADVFISLTHFKGHEMTGFGGAIKNIGMGCGSRAGKMDQHADGKPVLDAEACRGCRRCAKECGSDAISYVNNKAVIDYDKCKGCGRCIGACTFDAISSPDDSANEMLDRKMAEYAQAVCQDRPCFHISLVQDVSPNCDCHGENDAPILPDIGMFASFDPVALDQACADACMAAQPMPGSQLSDNLSSPGWECHHDHFKDSNPNIEWKATLEQAEKIGLGTRAYELKKI